MMTTIIGIIGYTFGYTITIVGFAMVFVTTLFAASFTTTFVGKKIKKALAA